MPGVFLYGWNGTDWVRVLVNAAGKLIIDPSELLEDTPTDGQLGKAPTSNWAHDHADLPDVHHVKYTDAEALAAAVQAGAITDAVTKAPTHDAVFDVKATADGAIAKSLLTEKGDVIYASGVATPAALAHGTSGQVLQSGGHGANPAWGAVSGLPTIVRKTADEIVNNSIALQDDNHLVLAVGANDVWFMIVSLWVISATATPDIDHAFAVPTGGTIRRMVSLSLGTPEIANDGTTETLLAVSPAARSSQFLVWYVGGGTAGNINLQWAQNVATVEDTKILKNSYFIAFKLG